MFIIYSGLPITGMDLSTSVAVGDAVLLGTPIAFTSSWVRGTNMTCAMEEADLGEIFVFNQV